MFFFFKREGKIVSFVCLRARKIIILNYFMIHKAGYGVVRRHTRKRERLMTNVALQDAFRSTPGLMRVLLPFQSQLNRR